MKIHKLQIVNRSKFNWSNTVDDNMESVNDTKIQRAISHEILVLTSLLPISSCHHAKSQAYLIQAI